MNTEQLIIIEFTAVSYLFQHRDNQKPTASAAIIFCSLAAAALSHYRWTLKNGTLIKSINSWGLLDLPTSSSGACFLTSTLGEVK